MLQLFQEVSQNKYNHFLNLWTFKSTNFIFYYLNLIPVLNNDLKTQVTHIQEKFGLHLKQLRESKGLSLRELAAKCDLDSSKISKMENGKTNLQLSSMFELAKGLGVEPKELLDFKI